MSNNKSIAKNTAYLYLRMLFSMGVTFYSSRIILEALGVSDFGIYNIVGGVVTAFAFLQSTLSGVTSRYFSFYIGKEDNSYLERFFSNSVILHIIVAFLFVLLGETIGIYLLNNVINIPKDRYMTGMWVFQLSLLTSVFNVITLPYNSLVISYEKMGFYALQGVLKSIFTLIVAFIILYYNGDRLLYYGFLLLLVSVFLFIINYLYVRKNYKKRFIVRLAIEKDVVKPIMLFFGLDLYGNFSVLINNQGISVVLNSFFGAVINAAIGVANQVNVAVNVFVSSFMMAVKPQIIKAYAIQDFSRLQYLVEKLSKFSFFLILIVALPLLFKIDMLLGLWLKEVPEHTNSISIMIILGSFLNIFIIPFGYVIHATGKMKRISFISGSFYLMVVPISYFLLKINSYYLIPFIVNFIALMAVSINNVYTTKIYIKEFLLFRYMKEVLFKGGIVLVIGVIVSYFINLIFKGNLIFNFIGIVLIVMANVMIIYIFGLNKEERVFSKNVIKNKMFFLK